MTLILLAVSPSELQYAGSSAILGTRDAVAAPWKGVFLPSPRRRHPAREAVVALVSTGLVNISENAAAQLV